jgi:hypothetical protein
VPRTASSVFTQLGLKADISFVAGYLGKHRTKWTEAVG